MTTLSGRPLDGYGHNGLNNDVEPDNYVSREGLCCPPAAVMIFTGLMLAANHALLTFAVGLIVFGVLLLMVGLGAPGTRTA